MQSFTLKALVKKFNYNTAIEDIIFPGQIWGDSIKFNNIKYKQINILSLENSLIITFPIFQVSRLI